MSQLTLLCIVFEPLAIIGHPYLPPDMIGVFFWPTSPHPLLSVILGTRHLFISC